MPQESRESSAGKGGIGLDPLKAAWPNPAESRLNYYNLIATADKHFGFSSRDSLKVAVVGAGVSGLAAARELLRFGIGRIHIFEASDRVGGRLRTEALPSPVKTPYEMGAMRMPFFDRPGAKNSAIEYYIDRFKLSYEPFPNPGQDVCDTGIWVNNGLGPDLDHPYRQGVLEVWRRGAAPPHPAYRHIQRKLESFVNLFRREASRVYEASHDEWWSFWHAVAATYWDLNFRDLVYLPRKAAYTTPGDFGGLGLSEKEAELFYVVGIGDGGWGAFYDVSALWVIRTMIFGYSKNLQSMVGKLESGSYPASQTFMSSNRVEVPLGFRGVQSLAECMLTDEVDGHGSLRSRIEQTSSPGPEVRLFMSDPVVRISRKDGQNHLSTRDGNGGDYDAVIITTPTWAGQFIRFTGLDEIQRFASPSMNRSHTIMSCKVYFQLRERFWEGDDPIPQVICTDTFIQGMYGYAFNSLQPRDPGVLLASYTWEDDALKLMGRNANEIGRRCLEHLDEIVVNYIDSFGKRGSFGRKISEYVLDPEKPRVFHWVAEPQYTGCAKLYRQRSWHYDYELLNFNRLRGQRTGIYFAGEAYSVEGGWTEPALRSAVDAVYRLSMNCGGPRPEFYEAAAIPDWCPNCLSLGASDGHAREPRATSDHEREHGAGSGPVASGDDRVSTDRRNEEQDGPVRLITPATGEHLAQVSAHLRSIFGARGVTEDELRSWQSANSRALSVLVSHSGRVLGHFGILPLDEAGAGLILSGAISTKQIPPERILPPNAMHDASALCVTSLHATGMHGVQGWRAAKLYWGMVEYMKHYYRGGSYVGVGVAATKEAERLLASVTAENVGTAPSTDGSSSALYRFSIDARLLEEVFQRARSITSKPPKLDFEAV